MVLPMARWLMEHDRPTEAAADSAIRQTLGDLQQAHPRLVTLTGQSRPVYWPLAVHLVLRVCLQKGMGEAVGQEAVGGEVAALAGAFEPTPLSRETVALVLWEALCAMEASSLIDDAAMKRSAEQRVEQVLSQSSPTGALHVQQADDQLDHWTYRELSGLHALANLALHAHCETWWQAARRVAMFHLEHTQPDYTTYEPWAVHAFLHWPETMVFADQQLHDTETNLHLGGERVGLLPALLLADAVAALRDPAFGSMREA